MTSTPHATGGWDALSRLRGFSCPEEGIDEVFLAAIAGEYSRRVTRLFLEAHAERLSGPSPGLCELLDSWSGEHDRARAAWNSAFGDAFRLVRTGEASGADAVAVGMALHIGAQGRPGAWSAQLEVPLPLRWDSWLLPPSRRVDVRSDGRVAELRLEDGRPIAFAADGEGWTSDAGESLPRFGRQRAVVLPRRALTLQGFDELVAASVEEVDAGMLDVLREAMGLLADGAPPYASWVERVVHELFLIQPQIKQIQSGSIAKYFGVVHVSAAPHVPPIAELLVHEASHQYFHLLCLLDPFDDGSDDNLYYSPAVRTERSLERIGVAYHAFANILRFYDACLASGVDDDGYYARNREALAPDVAQLEGPLRGNEALTKVGRALTEPLINRLHGGPGDGSWPHA